MDNPSPNHPPQETGFASAITAARESEDLTLSIPEIGERIAAAVGIDEAQAIRAVEIVREYSHGPIPGSLELSRLNQIAPSLGTDIAKDYLAQRQHTREIDTRLVTLAEQESHRHDGELHYASRGQFFAILSTIIFVAGAFGAMYLHYTAIAILLVAAPALGVITQFIKGFESSTSSSDNRRRSNTPEQL